MAEQKVANKQKEYIFAVGRRKEATARVRLYSHLKADFMVNGNPVNKGELYVNNLPITEYFVGETARHMYTEPIRIANAQNKYVFTIRVTGGGKAGQLDATVAGIARALSKLDPDEYRSVLKKKGLLTRDARVRERRKVGTGGKARREKQSPKR